MTRERPLRILLLALLSFVVGGFGIFVGTAALGRQLLFLLADPYPPALNGQVMGEQPLDLATFVERQAPGKIAVEMAANAELWLGGMVLVAVAFGLLHMRPWALWLGALYALVTLPWQVGYFAYQIGFVLPATQRYYVDLAGRMYYGYTSGAGAHLALSFVTFLLLQVGVFMVHAVLLLAGLASLPFRRAPEAISVEMAENPAGAALGSV